VFAGYFSELLFQASRVSGESIICLFCLAILAGLDLVSISGLRVSLHDELGYILCTCLTY
jgi:hypothetical protein